MDDLPWSWSDFDFDKCWEELMEAWKSKTLRDNLTKKSAPRDFQEGEDEDATREVRLPWHSAGFIWVEEEQP